MAIPARKIEYPESLPVVAEKQRIQRAIADNQVVVLAGETGSGKTTQIPKMLLEMGFAEQGVIGHTQPRRLAARSVANRIAEELKEPLGQTVGYKIRFQDKSSTDTAIKLMTDGILLAELQQDRLLKQYSVIIIDEAHERSLNIDFLLGVLKQICQRRKDLKVIITSATIETEKFAKHFNAAPVIEVSGRTYPVDVRYRPLSDDADSETDLHQSIIDATHELCREGPGDILVFLSGEREIRDVADALRDEFKGRSVVTEIIPLFARLSASEQNRVFQSHSGRRIVLATNVAETSLTVPGIRYVVDPGNARISRYSYRTKVQRLPIEPVSQASANQRAGRCGRVGPGVCIRLYSEDDFNNRPEFTDPEILRTNLASVILQMASLKLGDIRKFPFLQPPDDRYINDGLKLLEELGAMTPASKRRPAKLTQTGRQLGRLPVDPRLARMLLAAREFGCTREVMVIVSGLSIQDPRERPYDKQQKADELHQRFLDKDSDFLSYVNLWNYLNTRQQELSGSQFRKLCRSEMVHYLRVREWQDLYKQLRYVLRQQGIPINEEPASYELIHRALLTGLLSHIGLKDEKHQYLGARQSKFYIFPGSALFKAQPKWMMAAELVETSRLFARYVARIEPEWIEPSALHLVKRNYHEPRYSKRQGAVIATEQVTLFGLLIVGGRRVQYGRINAQDSREIFIREALVEGRMAKPLPFMLANQRLIESVRELEHKSRRRDILIDEEALFRAYDEQLPEDIYDDRRLRGWWKKASKQNPDLLKFTRDDLMHHDAANVTEVEYPDFWQQGQLNIPLSYCFEPNDPDDGVSADIPLPLLNQVEDIHFDWQIPALREELVVSLIKSLPKRYRRNFVPAPEYAKAFLQSAVPFERPLIEALSKELLRMSGITIPDDAWDLSLVPEHLKFNFRILDANGKVLKRSRNLRSLQAGLQDKVTETLTRAAGDDIEKSGLTDWSFGSLPAAIEKKQGKFSVKAFPALKDEGKSVALRLFDTAAEAQRQHRKGLQKLVLLQVPSPARYLREKLPNKSKLAMYFNPWGRVDALIDDCIFAAIDVLIADKEPQNDEEFRALVDQVRQDLNDQTLEIARQAEQCLLLSHQVQKQLKGKVPLPLVQSYGDIKAHLDSLIFPGFISEFGAARLPDIERYMKALAQRVEKLKVDPNKDRLRVLQVEKIAQSWESIVSKFESQQKDTTELREFRWALEEFRVSLFAQQLGTRFPVSEQRLLNRLKEISGS